jgi:hypothetical protein
LDKVTLWQFQRTSKEVIWPKKNLNLRKSWDGRALLVGPQKHIIAFEKLFLF